MTVRTYDLLTGIETTREYTEDEASSFYPPVDAKELVKAKILDMEYKQLMPRATREFMLMYMETNAPAEVLAVNPGYQAVKAFDEQIKALRAQL